MILLKPEIAWISDYHNSSLSYLLPYDTFKTRNNMNFRFFKEDFLLSDTRLSDIPLNLFVLPPPIAIRVITNRNGIYHHNRTQALRECYRLLPTWNSNSTLNFRRITHWNFTASVKPHHVRLTSCMLSQKTMWGYLPTEAWSFALI